MSELTKEQFVKHLRYGLNHLRNPNRLRQSPLATLFGVADQPDAHTTLRRILIEAVKSLKPEAGEPSQSRAWRLYESLLYRYVQCFSQREVADQLSISERQLRREQRAALQVLSHRLWNQLHVEAKLRDAKEAETILTRATANATAVYDNLAWLRNAPLESPTDLRQQLPALLDLVRPLAAQHGVQLEITMDDALPRLVADPIALRQTVLSLLNVAIPQALPGGSVRISASPLPQYVKIQVQFRRNSSDAVPHSGKIAANLDLAHRLADLCGGRLTVSFHGAAFSAVLTLPALGRLPVLAVDDNASTLHLLQRYTAGTRYRLVGTRDPEQALNLAEKHSPQIIVLDVMMPHVDGWEVLARLRQHPSTDHIPIIVCTILAQEELAFSLGASAFIQKPVTRQVFLAALDHQMELMESKSH